MRPTTDDRHERDQGPPRGVHLTDELANAYVDGALAPRERAAADAHLAACARCRTEVAELRGLVAALAALPEPRPRRSFQLLQEQARARASFWARITSGIFPAIPAIRAVTVAILLLLAAAVLRDVLTEDGGNSTFTEVPPTAALFAPTQAPEGGTGGNSAALQTNQASAPTIAAKAVPTVLPAQPPGAVATQPAVSSFVEPTEQPSAKGAPRPSQPEPNTAAANGPADGALAADAVGVTAAMGGSADAAPVGDAGDAGTGAAANAAPAPATGAGSNAAASESTAAESGAARSAEPASEPTAGAVGQAADNAIGAESAPETTENIASDAAVTEAPMAMAAPIVESPATPAASPVASPASSPVAGASPTRIRAEGPAVLDGAVLALVAVGAIFLAAAAARSRRPHS